MTLSVVMSASLLGGQSVYFDLHCPT